MHEAMLRVVVLPSVDEATVPGLLSTIVMRLAVDVARDQRRAENVARRVAALGESVVPVDEAVCDRSEARWLAERTACLHRNERDVLLGRARGDETGAVAARLGITHKAAQCAMTRARRTLRAIWRTTLVAAMVFARVSPVAAERDFRVGCNERVQPAICTVQTRKEAAT